MPACVSIPLLFSGLCFLADENGFAFPGLATLVTRIRMSRRQTIRLVDRLEGTGELLVLRRQGRGNLYIVRTAATRQTLAANLAAEDALQDGAGRFDLVGAKGEVEDEARQGLQVGEES